jgi:non-ribosomal peptide synthetase component E (peptide arylation enzyme)
VHACLEIKPDQALDLAAFKAFLKERLSGNEVPKTISTHPQLPRTALGKIDYPALRILLGDLPLQRL